MVACHGAAGHASSNESVLRCSQWNAATPQKRRGAPKLREAVEISQVQASPRAQRLVRHNFDRALEGRRSKKDEELHSAMSSGLAFRSLSWGWFDESIAPLGANGNMGSKPGAALADSFAPG